MSIPTTASRTRWAAVAAAVAITLGAVGLGGLNVANADVSSGDGAAFIPDNPVFIAINPCRLVDTRADLAGGTQDESAGARRDRDRHGAR